MKKIYRDSMSERVLRVMRPPGSCWFSAMEVGDIIGLPRADDSPERNTLSRALIRLCDAGYVERRIVDRIGPCGSRYEFRAIDPAQVEAES